MPKVWYIVRQNTGDLGGVGVWRYNTRRRNGPKEQGMEANTANATLNLPFFPFFLHLSDS